MKQRVYNTWLAVVVGAVALPLLVLCTPLFAADAGTDGALHVFAGAQEGALRPAEAERRDPPLPGEGVLMSCADGNGVPELPEFIGAAFSAPLSPSPLWCEDTDSGTRCAPAAPEPPRHDFGHASPGLLATLAQPVAPAFILVDVRHTPVRDDLRGRAFTAQHDRPPRA